MSERMWIWVYRPATRQKRFGPFTWAEYEHWVAHSPKPLLINGRVYRNRSRRKAAK